MSRFVIEESIKRLDGYIYDKELEIIQIFNKNVGKQDFENLFELSSNLKTLYDQMEILQEAYDHLCAIDNQ